jgi:hypothetical protein
MASIQTGISAMTVSVERPPRRQRPSTQYWDHRTASWQVGVPIPVPRRGE